MATKAPWPPIDGGRVVLAQTLAALALRNDVDVTLVAPANAGAPMPAAPPCRLALVPPAPRARWTTLVQGLAGTMPLAMRLHADPAVRARVGELLAAGRYDVVVAEQLQALPQATAARGRKVPVVLRAENVESDLLRARPSRHPLESWIVRREARRLDAWEQAALRAVDRTLALTRRDAQRLAALGGPDARVACVPAPFAATGLGAGPALSGAPAVVVFGSGGWFPNHEAVRWFVRAVWPQVRARLPEAVLHVFGPCTATGRGVVRHPAPADSACAFPAGAVFVVPLRTASGVRMKILEAWARGVAVVATSAAASGLEARDGEQLLIADTPDALATAIAAAPLRAPSMIAAGRALLGSRHDPSTVARALRDELTAAAAAAR